MKHMHMTTMLLLLVGAGAAFTQESTADDSEDAAVDSLETIAQGAEEGAEAAGSAVEAAADEVQTETPEPEADAPTDRAGAEAEVVETEQAVGEPVVREQAPNELRVDWITGTTVTSQEGEVIGNIDDLILDVETGEMSAAVLSAGGFLGIGAKQIAVDWSELQIDYDANEMSLDMTREEADAAPEYAFRDREQSSALTPADTGTDGITTDAGGGMDTGAAGDRSVPATE